MLSVSNMNTEDDIDFKAMLGALDEPNSFQNASWTAQYLKRNSGSGNTLTAVPPSFGNNGRARSNSGNIMASRLRAASDMHMQGVISGDEKHTMKTLILNRDPTFRELFTTAEKQGNWDIVRDALRSGKFDHAMVSRTGSSADALSEFADVNLAELPEDLSVVFDSAFGGMDFDMLDINFSNRKNSLQQLMQMQSQQIPQDIKPIPIPAPTPVHQKPLQRAPRAPPTSIAVAYNNRAPSSNAKPLPQRAPPASTLAGMPNPELAKKRKNERERKRRLAVSQGFDRLLKLLCMPESAKVDKASILQNAVKAIQDLEKRAHELKISNQQLQTQQQQ